MKLFIKTLLLSIITFFSINSYGEQTLLNDVKLVSTKNGVEVDFKFSKSFNFKNSKPEYERNFIQFVLTGVGIKNAKTVVINDDILEKVFVYPYSPGVTRVRFILKADAEALKGYVNTWNAQSSAVRVLVKTKEAARAVASSKKDELDNVSVTKEESEILKNVLKNSEEPAAATASVTATAATKEEIKSNSSQEQVGIKADPSRSFSKMILSLLVVIAVFIGSVFLVKRYAGKMDIKKLPFGKKEKLIQVVATHRLGRNQAISLVKITNEYMVMSVSGDNVSLIAKLGKDIDVDKYLEDRYWGGAFEKHLDKLNTPEELLTKKEPKFTYDGYRDLTASQSSSSEKKESPVLGIRQTIKSKINQLKPLS